MMINNNGCTVGTYVRFLNATDVDNLDFYLFNSLEFYKASPGQWCELVRCNYGTNTFRVCINEKTNVLASAFFDFYPNTRHIISAVGNEGKVSLCCVEEKQNALNSRYAHLKFCVMNNCFESWNVRANGEYVLKCAKPMEASKYIAFLPGSYELEIFADKCLKYNVESSEFEYNSSKINNEKEALAKLPKLHLNAGEAHCIFVCETSNDKEACKIISI